MSPIDPYKGALGEGAQRGRRTDGGGVGRGKRYIHVSRGVSEGTIFAVEVRRGGDDWTSQKECARKE